MNNCRHEWLTLKRGGVICNFCGIRKALLTASEMGKKRWAGVSKEERRAHALKAVQAREKKRRLKATEDTKHQWLPGEKR